MCFGTAPTYFSCIMKAFPFGGWDFYSEAMRELWPGCKTPWIVWNYRFRCHSQPPVPVHLMYFQKMAVWLSANLDNRMKYIFTIENFNSWPQKAHSLSNIGRRMAEHVLVAANTEISFHLFALRKSWSWICYGEIPASFG